MAQIAAGWLMIPLGIGLAVLHAPPGAGIAAVHAPGAEAAGSAALAQEAGAPAAPLLTAEWPDPGAPEGGAPEGGRTANWQRAIDQVVIPKEVLDMLPELEAIAQKLSAVDGVVTWGTDHRRGRVLVGVRSQEAKARVEAVIAREGISPELVEILGGAGLLYEERPLDGCELADPPRPEPGPYWLELEPAAATPGEPFTLWVRGIPDGEVTRGVDAFLECWDGAGWSPRFILSAGGGVQLYGGLVLIDAVGLPGPGPEAHLLPEKLEPGWYRIRKPIVRTPAVPAEAVGYMQVP